MGPRLVFLLTLLAATGAQAAALKAPATGCKLESDALKATALRAKKDGAGLAAFMQPRVASRSCIDLAKGVSVGIDETRAPLSCVRLTGDLECYWLPEVLVDLYPGQKGGGPAGRSGGGRRR